MKRKTLAGDRIRRGACGAGVRHVVSGWAAYASYGDGGAIWQDLEAADALTSPAVVSYNGGAVTHCPFPANDSRLISCCVSAGPGIDGKSSGNMHMACTASNPVLAPSVAQSDETVSRRGQTTAQVDSAPGHRACSVQCGPGQTGSGTNGGSLHDSSPGGVDSAESRIDRMRQLHVGGVCVNTGTAAGRPSVSVSLGVTGNGGGRMREMPVGAVP